eukprot:SAG31_NODE_244_length_19246_cov_20.233823_4_plen_146_part_00
MISNSSGAALLQFGTTQDRIQDGGRDMYDSGNHLQILWAEDDGIQTSTMIPWYELNDCSGTTMHPLAEHPSIEWTACSPYNDDGEPLGYMTLLVRGDDLEGIHITGDLGADGQASSSVVYEELGPDRLRGQFQVRSYFLVFVPNY